MSILNFNVISNSKIHMTYVIYTQLTESSKIGYSINTYGNKLEDFEKLYSHPYAW